ncbi:MAG: alanine--tRNA ligase [Candidatus Pacebacteria bacterium]|nr:alanine--tRNA ligase [Candidatus Paceibacterota bacterium]
MNSFDTRKAFLDFFVSKGHKEVKASSLIPTDESVLFTTAGMQQFKPYFLGEKSPYGNMVTTCQKCMRTSDIDNVGDVNHLTFFEMLGNFTFGQYFKKEAIQYAYEFLIDTLKLPKDRIWITYFKGDKDVEKDEESIKIWKELGISEDRMIGFSREDNFWGPTGNEGPCGPTTEIHYDLTGINCSLGDKCLPNCSCKRYVEIWNLVFNEFYQDKGKKLTPLKQNGVDTGMGLERLCMALQGKTILFETDLFDGIIKEIEKVSGKKYEDFQSSFRIIADHLKSAMFLIEAGILPGKNDREYILRRILRRAIRHAKNIGLKDFNSILEKIFDIYEDIYPEIIAGKERIISVIDEEKLKFEKTLEKGLKEFEKLSFINSEKAFYLYESYGFPIELTIELAKEKNINVDLKEFDDLQKKHQEISRAGAQKKFGGLGIDIVLDEKDRKEMTKLHTATHLLHQALRQILGEEVKQMGSDINPERLRFDFSFKRKLEKEELEKIENLINEKIKEGLEMKKEEMKYEDAIKSGALAFFKEKYPEIVNVYSIGNFSKEICAGPHVDNISELKCVKILKEEAVGAGVRRIKIKLNNC